MLGSISQHRASIGNNQNFNHRKSETKVTHMLVERSNDSSTPDHIPQFGMHIAAANNTLEMGYRTPVRPISQPGKIAMCMQLMLLIDNIRLMDPASGLSGEIILPATGDNAFTGTQDDIPVINLAVPDKKAKNQEFPIIENYPSLIPGADAAPVSHGNEGIVWDIKSDSYIITSDQKKNQIISSLVNYLISDGRLTSGEGNDFEFFLRSEAAGATVVISRLHNNESDSNRVKREQQAQQEQRIVGHIKEHCAFEEEILNAKGENIGKKYIVYAQRTENPFRMIYDSKDGRPSPEIRGVADGLNEVANMIFFLKQGIGNLIASLLRRQYYSDRGDEICTERYKRIATAQIVTSLNSDGLIYRGKVNSIRVKPRELLYASPAQPRAAFYTRNLQTSVRKEILLELKQGKGVVNENGREVYLKPTEKDNEFITYHPDAVKPELLERRVLVDESSLTWRYADTFDSDGLNVQVRNGKKEIELHGDYYELNQNSAGQLEVIIKKESGIREYIPVYMDPLSKKWHMNVHNSHPVFSNEQKEIISAIKAEKKEGFHYIPRSNNNEKYYGDGNIYHQEKMGDTGHYTWGRYIEMNGELVPVRNTRHEGQGVLYETYDIKNKESKGYPVEWDGDRWLFEKPTSVHISENVGAFLSDYKLIQDIDISKLSSPDHFGLRRSLDGSSYIKVNNAFYKMTLTDYGGIIHISENQNLGIKLSFGMNNFENDALLNRAKKSNDLTTNIATHTNQKLKRQGARKVKNTKALEDLISDGLINTHFRPSDISAQNSMGIRNDLSGNMHIKIKNGWVSISKNELGYFITDGKQKIRVEFTKNRWCATDTTPGFPPQLNYYPGEQATVKVSCSDGYSETFSLDSKKTLTKNILDHFDAIDDGVIFDISKSESTKHEFFSVNKVTITTSGSEHSVYYPDNKPGGFKYHEVLFDSVPVNFKKHENILITPDNYKTETNYPQYPHNINVIKQGTIKSCGYACIAMIAKDLKQVRNIDDSVINGFMALKDECSAGTFSSTLSEIMTESGIKNKMLKVENPARYIQDKIREDMWTGIVNIDGHFCIITKSDTHAFYFRDPYQGILSVEKTGRLKELKIGSDIIEL